MAASDGERGPGRARRAGTGRMNLVGLRAIESPGAPSPNLDADFQTWIWDISRTSTSCVATEVSIPTSVSTPMYLPARLTFHASALPPSSLPPLPFPHFGAWRLATWRAL